MFELLSQCMTDDIPLTRIDSTCFSNNVTRNNVIIGNTITVYSVSHLVTPWLLMMLRAYFEG